MAVLSPRWIFLSDLDKHFRYFLHSWEFDSQNNRRGVLWTKCMEYEDQKGENGKRGIIYGSILKLIAYKNYLTVINAVLLSC